MEDNRTNVEEINTTEATEEEVKDQEKSTDIVEVKKNEVEAKKEKKGFHPIKKTKEWVANHPKATKVIVATAGFAAGVAGTLVALKKVADMNDELDGDTDLDGLDSLNDADSIIDGDFTVSETTES